MGSNLRHDDEGWPAVNRELRSGEELVWCGRPDPHKYAISSTRWYAVLFGIFWTAIVVSMAWKSYQNNNLSLINVVFVGVGIAIVGTPLWKYIQGRLTIYAVTTQRLLTITMAIWPSMGNWPSVKSYTPTDIDEIECKHSGGGTGSIIFRRETRGGGKGGSYTVKIGFFGIPDVWEVEGYIAQLTKREK